MEMHKDTPVYVFGNTKEWEEWLSKNHDKVAAIWLKFAKKNSGEKTMSYTEAVPVALCYGWIDGLLNKYEEQFYVIRFTPRKAKSVWSKRNREIVESLIKEGKMQPSGLAKIEAAKANGSWDNAYDSSKDMQMPEDFLRELAQDKKAEEFFKMLNRANTYAIAWRLQTAKKPETRAKRMKKLLDMLKRGEKLY